MSTATMPWPPDTSRAPALAAYMWIGCALATIMVGTRLYARVFISRTPGWDDFYIALSYIFAVSLYATTQELFHNGYGHHKVYLSPVQIAAIAKLDIPVYISGITSLFLARTSIGVFLLRLVLPIRKLAIPVYVGLAINTIQAVGFIIWECVLCIPPAKTWDPSIEGSCMDIDTYTAVERFWGTLNVTVDLIFAIFPLVILGRNRAGIKRRLRLMIYLLLCCGLLTSVCGIGRIVATDLKNPDSTWALIPLTYWAVSETTAVLILSCMPAFHQLALHLLRTRTWREITTHLIPSAVRTSHRTDASSKTSHDGGELGHVERDVQVRSDIYVERSDRSIRDEPAPLAFEDQLVKSSQMQNLTTAWVS